MTHIIQFLSLFLLMLVTGIFWGPWFALSRAMRVFNVDEFIHIAKTMAANLGLLMRILMPACIFVMGLSIYVYPQKSSLGFYLNVASFVFIIISLVVTLLVELPIVKRIVQWTASDIPSDWESIRDRWVQFHVYRVLSAFAAFAALSASILFLH